MNKFKKSFKIFASIFSFLAIIAGVVLVRNNQNLREKAAPETSLYISPPNKTLRSGDSFLSTIKMDTGNNQVSGFDLVLVYDPNIFIIQSIDKGSDVNTTFTEFNKNIDNINGRLSYSAFSVVQASAIHGSGINILSITGKIKDGVSEGSYTISFDNKSAVSGLSEGQNVLTLKTSAVFVIPSIQLNQTPQPTATVTATPTSLSTPTPTFIATPTSKPTTLSTSTPTPPSIPVTGITTPTLGIFFVGVLMIVGSFMFF